jgi:hypothetical protein
MKLSELEQHVLAYYLIKGAADLNMDPRWWPPIELSSIIEDKVRFAVSRFDVTSRAAVDNAARSLLETLIAQKAFSTSQSDYGPMYQFQRPVFRTWLTEAQAANPIIARAASAGPDFWRQSFEKLKEQDV